MGKRSHLRKLKLTAAVIAAGTLGASIAAGVLSDAVAGAHQQKASAAQRSTVKDTAYMHQSHSNGNTKTETGRARGTLPGTVHGTITVKGTAGRFVFTFNVSGGTLTGHGSGQVHIGGAGFASFSASMIIDHGTGRYHNVSGSGHAYGTEDRLNHKATVQLVGNIRY